MTKVEEIKRKIEELKTEFSNIKKDLDKRKDSIYDLEKELDKEINYEYIRFCTQEMNGNYFHHTFSNEKYVYNWYIYVENVKKEDEESESFFIKGKSFELIYSLNNGERGELVTVSIDKDAEYLVTNGWGDSLAGYFKYNELSKITEVEYNHHKNKINEFKF